MADYQAAEKRYSRKPLQVKASATSSPCKAQPSCPSTLVNRSAPYAKFSDIKIKLVDIELLTIQIRLVVASVEKTREMEMDWWSTNSEFCRQITPEPASEVAELRARLAQLKARLVGIDDKAVVASTEPSLVVS